MDDLLLEAEAHGLAYCVAFVALVALASTLSLRIVRALQHYAVRAVTHRRLRRHAPVSLTPDDEGRTVILSGRAVASPPSLRVGDTLVTLDTPRPLRLHDGDEVLASGLLHRVSGEVGAHFRDAPPSSWTLTLDRELVVVPPGRVNRREAHVAALVSALTGLATVHLLGAMSLAALGAPDRYLRSVTPSTTRWDARWNELRAPLAAIAMCSPRHRGEVIARVNALRRIEPVSLYDDAVVERVIDEHRRGPRCYEIARLALRSGRLRLARRVARECGDDRSTLLAWEASFALADWDADPRDLPLLRRRLLADDPDLSGPDLYLLANLSYLPPDDRAPPFTDADFAGRGAERDTLRSLSRALREERGYTAAENAAWRGELRSRSIACRVLASERVARAEAIAALDEVATRASVVWGPLVRAARDRAFYADAPNRVAPYQNERAPDSGDTSWYARAPVLANRVRFESCMDLERSQLVSGRSADELFEGLLQASSELGESVHCGPLCQCTSRFDPGTLCSSFLEPCEIRAWERLNAARVGAASRSRAVAGADVQDTMVRTRRVILRSTVRRYLVRGRGVPGAPLMVRSHERASGFINYTWPDSSALFRAELVDASDTVGPATRALFHADRHPSDEVLVSAMIELEDDIAAASLARSARVAASRDDTRGVLDALGEPSLTAVVAFADLAPLLRWNHTLAVPWLRASLGHGHVGRSPRYDRARLHAALRRIARTWGTSFDELDLPYELLSFLNLRNVGPDPVGDIRQDNRALSWAVIEALREEARQRAD